MTIDQSLFKHVSDIAYINLIIIPIFYSVLLKKEKYCGLDKLL